MTFSLLDLKLIANAPNGHDIPFRILGNVQFVANALDMRIDRAGIPCNMYTWAKFFQGLREKQCPGLMQGTTEAPFLP